MKKIFSEALKELRIRAGYSQKEVYEMFNIRQSTFSAWETGRAEPSAEMLLKLCKLYNVSDVFSAFGYDGYNEDGSIQLNLKEIEHIEKYRALDPHGQETVSYILDREVLRVQQIKEAAKSSAQLPPVRLISYYQKLASAGSGEYLFDDIPTDTISVPDTPISRQADFAIGVNGQSMEPTYQDGDIVLVKKTEELFPGDIGIFIRGNECYIKELGYNRLISHNPDKETYPDISADERDICVVGKVVGKVDD